MKGDVEGGWTWMQIILMALAVSIPLGILFPFLWGKYQAGIHSTAVLELKALRAAVESYAIHGDQTYPSDEMSDWQSALMDPATRPKLIGSTLRDPFSPRGAAYRFDRSQNQRSFVVWSVGPDGIAGITGVDDQGNLMGIPGDDLFVLGGRGQTDER